MIMYVKKSEKYFITDIFYSNPIKIITPQDQQNQRKPSKKNEKGNIDCIDCINRYYHLLYHIKALKNKV